MRKNHSRRVPHEEAARRQEQLSSRHLLQAGGQGCVRRFQISPDHGFHRKCDSLASRDTAGVVTALVTGRRTELRRFQISPDHGFYRRNDSSSSKKKKKAGLATALVTGRGTELRRFQISLDHGFRREDHSWSSRERAVLVALLVVEGGKEHGGTDPSGLSCQRRFDLAAPGHGGRLRVVPSVVEPSNHHPQWRTRTALLRGTLCTLRPHGRCHAAKKVEGYEPHPSSCA